MTQAKQRLIIEMKVKKVITRPLRLVNTYSTRGLLNLAAWESAAKRKNSVSNFELSVSSDWLANKEPGPMSKKITV